MPLRIVVINDVQAVLQLFHEILAEEGHELLLYSYGFQDLVEIEKFKPDLIIVDFVIGNEGPSWQILQMIKMRQETAHIPIIICTAYLKYIQEIEGNLNLKGVMLVTKTFETEALLQAIERVMVMGQELKGISEHKSDNKPGKMKPSDQ